MNAMYILHNDKIFYVFIQGDQKVSVQLTITVQKTRKNTVF
jgi:hypothetical protein